MIKSFPKENKRKQKEDNALHKEPLLCNKKKKITGESFITK